MPAPHSEHRARLLRRLAVAADIHQPYSIRLAAVAAVLKMLPTANPLRSATAEELLERMKQPWDVRLYLENGRGVERQVTRPPVSLADVW